MRRRLGAGAVLLAALLVGPAGSVVPSAQAGATAHDPAVRVVHTEMRCHTVGDHEAF